MDDKDCAEEYKRRRAEEASNILRRLDENPHDTDALADKAAFLARGEAERRTFAYLEKAYAAAQKGLRGKDLRFSIALVGMLLTSLYFAWAPLRISVLADHKTRFEPASTQLASGDSAALDAATALQDKTDGSARSVTLLQGSAYFDVVSDGRPFVVTAGNVEVSVLGTSFEVAKVNGAVVVGVAEGSVEFRSGATSLLLTEGDRAILSDDGLTQDDVGLEDIASWRRDRLSITGLTFSEAATLVDRRLPGRVIVIGSDLSATDVGGNLNLTDPRAALEALAASSDAAVVTASRYLTIIYSR